MVLGSFIFPITIHPVRLAILWPIIGSRVVAVYPDHYNTSSSRDGHATLSPKILGLYVK